MPVPHYGVWVGKPLRYTAQTAREDRASPHIYLYFTDDSSRKERSAAINVKSIDKDTRLVFWLSDNFSHPVTKDLSGLELGFQLTQSQDSNGDFGSQSRRRHRPMLEHQSTLEGLDFTRTKSLVNIPDGKLLPHDVPGPDNDILDRMCPIIENAIQQDAKAYIFGSSFGSGIHDIHMNQGSLPRFDNGIYEDGALLFEFPDKHWEAVFLAFASQRIPTNGAGEPERGSKSLAVILGQEEWMMDRRNGWQKVLPMQLNKEKIWKINLLNGKNQW